jgi:hypothetical protein
VSKEKMKYMRRPAGYTWTDYKTNAQIAKRFKNNTNFEQNYWNTRDSGYKM